MKTKKRLEQLALYVALLEVNHKSKGARHAASKKNRI